MGRQAPDSVIDMNVTIRGRLPTDKGFYCEKLRPQARLRAIPLHYLLCLSQIQITG